MGLRVLAHSSPEPASHSVLSMGEDLTVLGLLALAYSHPYIAIPVLVALLLVIALLLPLVSRTINLLLAGLSGVFMAPVKRPGRHDLPQWVDLAMLERDPPGHGVAMRAFARRVKGVSRLRDGYLVNVDGQWSFLYRAFFRTKVLELESGPVRVDKRMLWRTTIFMRQGKPQIFFVPKDWAQHLGA
ncbi:MAG: DUF4126 domain-containing protein, partial [Firmicutes bacterium]|nr:DUF4126 domain-containing protein [Bacillota bacterium]